MCCGFRGEEVSEDSPDATLHSLHSGGGNDQQMQIPSNSLESGFDRVPSWKDARLHRLILDNSHACRPGNAELVMHASAQLSPVFQRDPHLIEQETEPTTYALRDGMNHRRGKQRLRLAHPTHQLLKVDQVVVEGLVPFVDEGDIFEKGARECVKG